MQLIISRALITATLCLCPAFAQLKEDIQPWQGTFTKTAQVPHLNTNIVVDFPQPPEGRLLTIEQISVVVGPLSNIYGKAFSCALDLSSPGSGMVRATADMRIQLPALSLVENAGRTWMVHSPVKLYAGAKGTNPPRARVICAVDAMVAGDTITVAAVGYTTPL